MFALKITYKGKDSVVGVINGLLTVCIYDESEKCCMYANAIETESEERNVWFDAEEVNEEIDIEVIQTESLSVPLKIEQGISFRKTPSKHERYRMLKEILKEKGLI